MAAGSDDNEAGNSDDNCVKLREWEFRNLIFFLTIITNCTYGVRHLLATHSLMSS
jgi:hypothetical protein